MNAQASNNVTEGMALSPISRRINRFISVSYVLSSSIFACSMVLDGATSFWMSPAGFLFTMIHHTLIFYNRVKLRKMQSGSEQVSPGSIPLSSRRRMIFLAWFASLLYLAAFAISLFFVASVFDGAIETDWKMGYIATIIELVCLLFEIPLMFSIGLWSVKERRALLGSNGTEKWYQLPQYNRTSCKLLTHRHLKRKSD
jgi:hypothetical protein